MAQVYVIGRVTADPELKTSVNKHPYMRFDIAENIGSRDRMRTQYYQVCAMDGHAQRIAKAYVKKGCLLWISGSLELEVYTKRDGVTTDKRMKIMLDNWGFVPIRTRANQALSEQSHDKATTEAVVVIDGDRDSLPE